MKTISFNRYSYRFLKNTQGQPVVIYAIEGDVKQIVRVTPEAGNGFYTACLNIRRNITAKLQDNASFRMFGELQLACHELNSITLSF